mmetsp:Transcript_3297/g.4780  ORF Transcript_3297/g.4780 Transcript_3297/m.4780 type:complete len:223 (-) Transcript_3297:171-839(-)|eukprot:CAMPEP_0184489578 /NCGR_PEP_ID=MMETSP0113_2-20130426/15849_1 /TAXON_ID=91329 /ORGANISM="Norrisiella sphaerica, Strain BC52" /LENGTH=222 /DNA_ID=CAMNT_0026873087 /DNA_START=883 /DNA_END=1551 /DNA_ORIENTATION=-
MDEDNNTRCSSTDALPDAQNNEWGLAVSNVVTVRNSHNLNHPLPARRNLDDAEFKEAEPGSSSVDGDTENGDVADGWNPESERYDEADLDPEDVVRVAEPEEVDFLDPLDSRNHQMNVLTPIDMSISESIRHRRRSCRRDTDQRIQQCVSWENSTPGVRGGGGDDDSVASIEEDGECVIDAQEEMGEDYVDTSTGNVSDFQADNGGLVEAMTPIVDEEESSI